VPKRKWYSLIDKVWQMDNLVVAAERVVANKGAGGVDGQTCEAFAAKAELPKLHEELRTKTYRPQPVRRVFVPKANGGRRGLGVPAVRDRVVQQALRQVIEPIFEAKFLPCSYGFREGISAHMALIPSLKPWKKDGSGPSMPT
jgi:retron-type reverse transcriptase